MSWFEAEIAALREAAGAATSVAEQAETIDLSATIDTIASGLPGSRAAEATSELAQVWTERLRTRVQLGRLHPGRLRLQGGVAGQASRRADVPP